MTTWLIIGGLIIGLPVIAACIWLWRSRDKAVDARHAAPRNFRPEAAQPVTLPLRLPEVPLHRDVVAATFGRGHLFADLNQAHAAYWRRQAPDKVDDLVAGFVPPEDVIPPRVVAALTRAGSEDTVVTSHDLEAVIGGDPWDGLGSADAWLDRLFGATA